MSKKFVNKLNDVVDDALYGLVARNANLQFHPECSRVVMRSDLDEHFEKANVSLISGGGSGHEPFASGYVGKGMLTAAVAGNVFASPPSRHVQDALEATNSPGGALVLVINYTGDRLNFGYALERFRDSGHLSEAILICDDVAIESPSHAVGKRGLAGAVLVIKAAGAMSEMRHSLDAIYAYCKKINENMATLAASLYPGSVPGKPIETTMKEDQIEIGLGIHGEPGKTRVAYRPAKEIVDELLNSLQKTMQIENGEKLVVMVNNLGAVSQLEMNIIAKEVVDWCKLHQCEIERLFVGTYMTSLNGHGVSVTFVRVFDESLLVLLDADAQAPGWQVARFINRDFDAEKHRHAGKNTENAKSIFKDVQKSGAQFDEHTIRECVKGVCAAMGREESRLNSLDGAVGDGDCGSTFAAASRAIYAAMDKLECAHPQTLLQQLSAVFASDVGGTSGALYALMLNAASRAFETDCTSAACIDALDRANQCLQQHGGARPGDRTMVDALNAIVKSLQDTKTGSECSKTRWANAIKTCEDAAEATANLRAAAGRASYTAHAEQTQPDAGAIALSTWLRALHDTTVSIHDKKD